MVLDINLQLFGGGGSSSGLGGGGKKGEGKKNGISEKPTGYFFAFVSFHQGHDQVRWIEGKNLTEAIKNAEQYGRDHGVAPTSPISPNLPKDEARKWYNDWIENRKKKK